MTNTSFDTDGLARLDAAMQGYVDRGEVAGFVTALSRGGATVIKATGVQDLDSGVPMADDTIFRIASLTKPVTAVAAMQLIEAGALALDDPIGIWLPEMANPRVLRAIDAELDDTVPANRPLVVRDLMRYTLGHGAVMTGPVPIQAAMQERGVAPGPFMSRITADEWIASLASLPLVHQPGEDWLYNTGSDVLGVLIERLTGQTLETRFRERIFEPLGMVDTGFSVPDEALDRFATGYKGGDGGGLEVADPARGGAWSGQPPFHSGAGGLVSTAVDYLRFARMLHHGGALDGVRIVDESSVREMARDQITAEEKDAWPSYRVFLGSNGWGYGVSVTLEKGPFGHAAGTYGWTGGWNTHWCNDPASDLIGMVFFQRLMGGPHDTEASGDFWRFAYESLDS